MKPKLQNKLSVAQLNINAVEKKFIETRFFLDKQLVEILVINESKIESTIDDSLFIALNYELHRLDRTRRGGGVIIFLKMNIRLVSIEFSANLEIIEFVCYPNDDHEFFSLIRSVSFCE